MAPDAGLAWHCGPATGPVSDQGGTDRPLCGGGGEVTDYATQRGDSDMKTESQVTRWTETGLDLQGGVTWEGQVYTRGQSGAAGSITVRTAAWEGPSLRPEWSPGAERGRHDRRHRGAGGARRGGLGRDGGRSPTHRFIQNLRVPSGQAL